MEQEVQLIAHRIRKEVNEDCQIAHKKRINKRPQPSMAQTQQENQVDLTASSLHTERQGTHSRQTNSTMFTTESHKAQSHTNSSIADKESLKKNNDKSKSKSNQKAVMQSPPRSSNKQKEKSIIELDKRQVVQYAITSTTRRRKKINHEKSTEP